MKYFIITIDTEEDGQWNPDALCTTENAKYLPRFQELSEKYGFKPTYLTTYAMAKEPFFVEYMKKCLDKNTCEIGMHLHAWNNPPYVELNKVNNQRDYLIEYSEEDMESKIFELTNLLEQTFGIDVKSHRSGRWVTNDIYFKLLKKYGYIVDCSVTPHMNWSSIVGSTGLGGNDYSNSPTSPDFILNGMYEVPMSIVQLRHFYIDGIHSIRNLLHEFKFCLRKRNIWFRPNNHYSYQQMKSVIKNNKNDYIEFMIHSSELMPGGSPSFKDEQSIERLYMVFEKTFKLAKQMGYVGCTLSEYSKIKLEKGES